MRISECQARTLAEAKELNLSVPLNDGTKLNVTELGNPLEDDSDNEDNSNTGASYRGKINDYPNDLSEGEIASVNGNIIIGNGNTLIRAIYFNSSWQFFNYKQGIGNFKEDKIFLQNIRYVCNSNNETRITDIVLSDDIVEINKYTNIVNESLFNDLTIVSYVKINNVDGVICKTKNEYGYILFSDNFSEMFELSIYDNYDYIELKFFDKSDNTVLTTNHGTIISPSTALLSPDIFICTAGTNNIDYINKNYDEFLIANRLKIANNTSEEGNIIIDNNHIKIITKLTDKLYAGVNTSTGEVTNDKIITDAFLKNTSNWNIGINVENVEIFHNANQFSDYLENNGLSPDNIFNINQLDSLLADYSENGMTILLHASESGQNLYILFIVAETATNRKITGGEHLDLIYDVEDDAIKIDDVSDGDSAICYAKSQYQHICVEHFKTCDNVEYSISGDTYNINNITVKQYSPLWSKSLSNLKSDNYTKNLFDLPNHIYTMYDKELGNIGLINIIDACILEGHKDIADYLIINCLDTNYYVEIKYNNNVYNIPILHLKYDSTDSHLDFYHNYEGDDGNNYIAYNICKLLADSSDAVIISPLIQYDNARISKFDTNKNENSNFNHFTESPLYYLLQIVYAENDVAEIGFTKSSDLTPIYEQPININL